MPEADFSIQIQSRDLMILRSLFESRVMTLSHIAALHFEDKMEPAKKRLQKLKAAELIIERRPHLNRPSTLFLSGKALSLLESEGILGEYPPLRASKLIKRTGVSEATMRHELEVMDVKAAITSALRTKPTFSVAEFSTWPALNEFSANVPGDPISRTMRPDGYLEIDEEQGNEKWHSRFFLEVDRSNEDQRVLIEKCACYSDYYRTGGFAFKKCLDHSQFSKYAFRVLIVCKTAERRNNTAEKLLQMTPPITKQVYLSTLAEVKADPLGPIWVRPLEYREVTEGTAYDPLRIAKGRHYKTQSERERLVERVIKKRSMLDEVAKL